MKSNNVLLFIFLLYYYLTIFSVNVCSTTIPMIKNSTTKGNITSTPTGKINSTAEKHSSSTTGKTVITGKTTGTTGKNTSITVKNTSITGKSTSITGKNTSITGKSTSITGKIASITADKVSTNNQITNNKITTIDKIITNNKITSKTTSSNKSMTNAITVTEIISTKDKLTTNISDKSYMNGGKDAEVGQFPYVVSLWYNYNESVPSEFVCSGAILNNKIILTAAHCVFDKDKEKFGIVGGILDSKAVPENLMQISDIIIHENYDKKTIENDIALMILKENYEFGDKIQPIEILEKTPIQNEECLISGWGSLNKNNKTIFPTLKAATALVDEKCSAEKLIGKKICVGKKEGSPCFGDSGSPLVCDKKLAGIAIINDIDCQHFGVYASINNDLVQWIQTKTKSLETYKIANRDAGAVKAYERSGGQGKSILKSHIYMVIFVFITLDIYFILNKNLI